MSRHRDLNSTDLLNDRTEFEARLGHYLASTDVAMSVSREMILRCSNYVSERALRGAADAGSVGRSLAHLYRKIMRPVLLPFSGRPRNFADLKHILSGDGNIRELQGTIWLVVAHVIAEDLVGAERRSDVFEVLHEAGLDATIADNWCKAAVANRTESEGRAISLEMLRPNEDFALMPWHEIRKRQLDTREIYSQQHQRFRHWSLVKREDFLREGGVFSKIEDDAESPLGREFVPWLDARRFCRVRKESDFWARSRAESIPVSTGISGVAMHTMEITELLGIADKSAARIATFGYLMSTKAHSFYEIAVSVQSTDDPDKTSYRQCVAPGVDWRHVEARCGRIMIPP